MNERQDMSDDLGASSPRRSRSRATGANADSDNTSGLEGTDKEAASKMPRQARSRATPSIPAVFQLAASADFEEFKRAAESTPTLRVSCDPSGDFLLHFVVKRGRVDLCRYLLDRGFPADLPGSQGTTPMHYAADKGNVEILRILQKRHRGRLPITRTGITPLHVAAGHGHLKLVKILIKAPDALSQADKFGRLPVHYAAGADQIEVVRFLMRKDPSLLDQPDCFGQTPLHWAMLFECPNAATHLLRAGADASISDIYGRSPFWFLIHSTNAELQALRQKVLRNNPENGGPSIKRPPEHRAILGGDVAEARRRIKQSGFRCRKDGIGWTALHAAAFARNRRLCDWLKRHGFDEQSVDDYGWTALKLLSFRLRSSSETRSRARGKEF